MIRTKQQIVRAKPNEGDNRPTDKNGEIEVCTVEVLDREPITNWDEALEWLVTQYTTPQTVVENFIRQDTQDIANRARADYKTGGDRAAREARQEYLYGVLMDPQATLERKQAAKKELVELGKKRR